MRTEFFARRLRTLWIALTLLLLLPTGARPASAVPNADLPRVFHEPLAPMGGAPTRGETSQLREALNRFVASKAHGQPDWGALTGFLAEHPNCAWNPSLLLNLGEDYYDNGYFSLALDAWEQAWNSGKSATDRDAQALANRALAQWLRMLCRLGRLQEAEAALPQIQGRNFQGSTARMIETSQHSVWMMVNHPELTYRCGPHALERILAYTKPQQAIPTELVHSVSGVNGIPMTDVVALAHRIGLDYQTVKRTGTASIPLPAVAHWKLNHYAAVLKFENGRYLIDDPTFGNGLLWVSADALDSETDGYFLIPAGSLPAGWRAVTKSEGATVWGRGDPPNLPPPEPPDPGDGDGGDDPENDDDPGDPIDLFHLCPGSGMAGWNVELAMINLRAVDSPVGYTPPVGPKIYFNVHYNEQAMDQPATMTFANLGPQWTCDWVGSLTFDTANAYYHSGQGGVEQFPNFDPATQTYQPSVMQADTLLKLSLTNYVILRRSGSQFVFGLPDNPVAPDRIFLTQIVDPQGNAATLAYDNFFRLTGITDAIGQTTTITYGSNTAAYLIQKVTDPFGRSAIFSYDATGELTNITDVLGLTSAFTYNSLADLQTLTTGYGTTSFTLGTNTSSDRFVQITEPDGELERFEEGNGTTPGVAFSEATLPNGILAFNEYLDGRDTYYWDRQAMAVAHGIYTNARSYHFMHQDLNTRSPMMESIKLPGQNRIWFNYQGQNSSGFYNYGMYGGAPAKVGQILANGDTQLSQTNYNVLGYITQSVDPVGRTLAYTYASNNIDLVQIARLTGPGQMTTLASYTWNSQHLPLTLTDTAGQTTTLAYNSRGQPVSVTNPKGQTTTYTYNSSNYLTAIQGPLGGSDTVSFTYDAYGRVATVTDVGGYVLTYGYDALNRLTNVTYPDGTFSQLGFNLLDPVSYRDRLGRVTTYTYDSLRQLTEVQDPAGLVTHFQWCSCGGLGGVIDPLGRLTQWTHDLAGRLTAMTYPDGSSTTYNYDSAGLLQYVTDGNGQTKLFAHDLDNSVTSISYANTAAATPAVQFIYDPWFPRLIERVDGSGATYYSYYPLTGDSFLGAGRLETIDGPLPNDTIAYSYDELGRVVSQSLNGATESVGYDALDRIVNVTNLLGSFNYAYVGATPRLSSVSYPNGQSTAFTYLPNSADHRLQEIWNKLPGGATSSKFDYSYNANGLITSWTQQHGSGSADVLTPTYDPDDRLLGVTVSNPAQNFAHSYDDADNRLAETVNGSAVAFSYNPLNELVALSTNVESARTYQWDAEHRLTNISYVGTAKSTQLTYDGLSHCVRIVEMSGGAVTSDKHFIWSGQSIAEECDAAGVATNYFFPQGVQIAEGSLAGSYYYARDHLGSIAELTDASGTVRADYQYDPWGQPSKLSGDLSAEFGFAGYYIHGPSALDLAPLRAYDPFLGRWLSRDPLLRKTGSANRYAYADNDPFNVADPLGADSAAIGLYPARMILPAAVGYPTSPDVEDDYRQLYPDPIVGAFGPRGLQVTEVVRTPLNGGSPSSEFQSPRYSLGVGKAELGVLSVGVPLAAGCQRGPGPVSKNSMSYAIDAVRTGTVRLGSGDEQNPRGVFLTDGSTDSPASGYIILAPSP